MAGRDLVEWEDALQLAEEDLREREQRALLGEPTPEELRAFASERDKLALDRDALADAHDEQARGRDGLALDRDVRGSARDRAARAKTLDRDAGAVARFIAGSDRDFAAGDRGDSHDDRVRSAAARHRAAEDRQRAADDRDTAASGAEQQEHELAGLREALTTRLVIGQAEGLLMARYHLSSEAAFRMLTRLSQETHVKLRDVAARLVADAEAGTA